MSEEVEHEPDISNFRSHPRIVISNSESELHRNHADQDPSDGEEGELKGLSSKVLEFMGLPRSYRQTLFDEYVPDVDTISSIPGDTAISFYSIVKWICGKGDGEQEKGEDLEKDEKKAEDPEKSGGDDGMGHGDSLIGSLMDLTNIQPSREESQVYMVETPATHALQTVQLQDILSNREIEINNNKKAEIDLGYNADAYEDTAAIEVDKKKGACSSEASLHKFFVEEETDDEEWEKRNKDKETRENLHSKRVTFATPPSETNMYASHGIETDTEDEREENRGKEVLKPMTPPVQTPASTPALRVEEIIATLKKARNLKPILEIAEDREFLETDPEKQMSSRFPQLEKPEEGSFPVDDEIAKVSIVSPPKIEEITPERVQGPLYSPWPLVRKLGATRDIKRDNLATKEPKKKSGKEAQVCWKEPSGVLLSTSVCEMEPKSNAINDYGSYSSISDHDSRVNFNDKMNANFEAPISKSNTAIVKPKVSKTRVPKPPSPVALVERKPTQRMKPPLYPDNVLQMKRKASLSRVSFTLPSATAPVKSRENLELTTTVSTKSCDNLKASVSSSNVKNKDELKKDLKTLEDIVKSIYKSLNKEGPLTIKATFKPRDDGGLDMDFGAKSNSFSPTPSKTPFRVNSSAATTATSTVALATETTSWSASVDHGVQVQFPQDKMIQANFDKVEAQTPNLQKEKTSHSPTGIMKSSPGQNNQSQDSSLLRKPSVSFAPTPPMTPVTVPIPSAPQLTQKNPSHHSLMEPIKITDNISLTVQASTTQIRGSTKPKFPESEQGQGEVKYKPPPPTYATSPEYDTKPKEYSLPSYHNPSLHHLKSSTSFTNPTYASHMRIIQPCSIHAQHSQIYQYHHNDEAEDYHPKNNNPSLQIIQPSQSESSSISSATASFNEEIYRDQHPSSSMLDDDLLDSHSLSCPNHQFERQSSFTSSTYSNSSSHAREKKRQFHIPQPPPSQRHNSYKEIFLQKQQQNKQTFYVDLTSKGKKPRGQIDALVKHS